MTEFGFKLKEGILTALLVVFIAFLFIRASGGTDKPMAEIAPPVLAELESAGLTEKTAIEAAKVFVYDRDKAAETVYSANESVMDVSEVLMIKLADSADAQEIKAAIEKRVEEQKNLYKSYAPQQYALLERCVIQVSGNTVFYCTAENADRAYDTFKNQL